MADDFTRKRFVWLDQVFADPAVTKPGFVLAYCIAKFFNRETGLAWPARPTLAAAMRMDERTVRRLCDQLEAAGHLQVIASRGRGHSCRYRPIFGQMHLPGIEAPEPEPEPEPQETAAPKPTAKAKTKAPRTTKAQRTSAIDEAFNLWWDQYPKKVDKKAAQKAYGRIISKGEASSEELLAGVLRYAAAVTGKEDKHIKNPSGWLNGARWTDEAPPAGLNGLGKSHSDRARSSAPAKSWTEINLEGLRDDQFD